MKTALLLSIAALALAAGASRAAPPPEPSPPSPLRPEVVDKAVKAGQRALHDKLAKDFPADLIEVREEAGPFDTVVAVAAAKGAYPGTGVLRLPLDGQSGVGYGRHGERSFGDFARERGWLAKAPPAAELVRFLNIALLDGVAILDSDPPPRVRKDESALVIELVRRFMPSHAGERLIVTVPAAGREVVVRRPL